MSKSLYYYFFPRIQDGFFVGLLIAVWLIGPSLFSADGDLGRHITIGTYMIENRNIPTRDIFSHTMTGERLVPHEWLAQVALASAHALMGLSGDVVLAAILIATTFTLTYREMIRRNVSQILALVITILAAFASSLHWIARPHLFTFLLLAIWSYQLEYNSRKVWLFPIIMLIWANTHGAFIAGFVIWGAHMAGWVWDLLQKQSTIQAGWHLFIIGIASFVVTLINPAGWHLWGTSVGYFGSQFLIDQTVEYKSPNFHNWSTWSFLAMLGLSLIMLSFRGRLRTHEALLLAGWTAMSLYSARNIPLFAIITAPYLAQLIHPVIEEASMLRRLDQTITSVEKNLRGTFYPALATILLIGASIVPGQSNNINDFDPNRFPVSAVDWLHAHPQDGKMFNNFIWGGYLLYRLWPQQLVFIDGQTDFYGEALSREYIQVSLLQTGWENILKKHEVSWVIVQSDKPLVNGLREQLRWEIIYRDDTATILRKP